MRNQSKGFTLIEVLVVVVIVGILAAIALPSYREQVLNSRRADAKVTLTETAQRLERCFTQFGRYNDVSCSVTSPIASPEGFYTITMVRDQDSYTLTATPLGDQLNDKKCTTLKLDSVGNSTATGSAPAKCW